ncbi:MAG TPA: STAS domain-containing protein [Planctomycetaceae bacterium]|nr:STAS domain-containing protein [Planctomycetaceae bacterium]
MARSQIPQIFPHERRGATLVVRPRGDSLGVQELDLKREIDALHKLIDDPRVTGLLVDVGQAPYFSSIVLGAVLAMCQKIRGRGGRAAFCNASPGMLDIMQIMKLDSVLPYYATCEEALAALADA